jgi:hypothetical protein
MRLRTLAVVVALASACGSPPPAAPAVPPSDASSLAGLTEHRAANPHATIAYRWVDVLLEATGREVDLVGARPTIISRQMAIVMTAMYDAWAAYDERAVGTRLGGALRRPPAERTLANKEAAISHACFDTLVAIFPAERAYLEAQMRALGQDPAAAGEPTSAVGIGRAAAAAVLAYRRHDGANELGDDAAGKPEPYADTSGYRPRNDVVFKVLDAWQPIPFADGKGGTVVKGFLTPHWLKVRPFALERADQFRPGPPPLFGSTRLAREVDDNVEKNATLLLADKALVEFMRDGPRSTGQSGHWLQFAQDVSRRDRHDLDRDVKLFFTVANTAFDAFIAAWDSKRVYDSPRPWSLVRRFYDQRPLRGYLGPCRGVGPITATRWQPYSPDTFVTPPFPGYVSGHSTVSGACAEILRLFTGSDRFDLYARHDAGMYTEEGCAPAKMVAGTSEEASPPSSSEVILRFPTFTATADLAGRSRVLGGYHIEADNVEGLALGRKVATWSWPVYQRYFDGTAPPPAPAAP